MNKDNTMQTLKTSALIPRSQFLKRLVLILPDTAGAVKGSVILPKSPSSLPDLIPCAERPDCLNVGYTQMTDILSWVKY